MKKLELIKALKQIQGNPEVCITDWRKNIHHANDEPQGHGIEPNFNVEFVNESVNVPFIALSFENNDYNDNGTPNEGSSIYSSIKRTVNQ
jgi:hypothetical protein